MSVLGAGSVIASLLTDDEIREGLKFEKQMKKLYKKLQENPKLRDKLEELYDEYNIPRPFRLTSIAVMLNERMGTIPAELLKPWKKRYQ